MKKYSKNQMKRDIMKEGRVLGLHNGSTAAIADRVVEEIDEWVMKRGDITEADLNRVASSKLKKYNPDLAYMYKMKGKVI
ncbi:MAG: hypothetical protein Q4F60_02200 [Candidatus Saccharibacteria bacterium]|nr:hypothetical protein [Candidatus Saccharibacteria bacterium]